MQVIFLIGILFLWNLIGIGMGMLSFIGYFQMTRQIIIRKLNWIPLKKKIIITGYLFGLFIFLFCSIIFPEDINFTFLITGGFFGFSSMLLGSIFGLILHAKVRKISQIEVISTQQKDFLIKVLPFRKIKGPIILCIGIDAIIIPLFTRLGYLKHYGLKRDIIPQPLFNIIVVMCSIIGVIIAFHGLTMTIKLLRKEYKSYEW